MTDGAVARCATAFARTNAITSGSDTLTGANDDDYKPPFPLTATLDRLTIRVDRPQLSEVTDADLSTPLTRPCAGAYPARPWPSPRS